MGCGAAVVRPPANSKKTPNDTDRQTTAKTQASEGLIYFYFFSFFFRRIRNYMIS
jgi:hypothetical protein